MVNNKKTRTLILGAGLAGLSAAQELIRNGEKDLLIIERALSLGGLMQTSFASGEAVDHLPHVFFTNNPAATTLYHQLISNSHAHQARLGVYLHSCSRFIDYPYQLHVHALPFNLRMASIAGYCFRPRHSKPATFEEYLISIYGRPITAQFFRPYNEKLWCKPLAQLSTEWVREKIAPITSLDMLYSFLGNRRSIGFGPHAKFCYPKTGGIQSIIKALADRIGPDKINLGHTVEQIDTRAKIVHTDKASFRYEHLVCTLPLFQMPKLLGVHGWQGIPLVYNRVTAVHVVCAKSTFPPYHWIYITDSSISFYRVTRVDLVQGQSGKKQILIIEVASPGSAQVDQEECKALVLAEIIRLGFVTRQDILFSEVFSYSPAYVVYDLKYAKACTQHQALLAEHNIIPAGRFGEWAFFNMDKTMLSGIQAAQKVLQREQQ